MKEKIFTVISLIVLGAAFAFGIYMAVFSIRALVGMTINPESFLSDSFWTTGRAIGIAVAAIFICGAAAAGIIGRLMKKNFTYIIFVVFYICGAALCAVFLYFYIETLARDGVSSNYLISSIIMAAVALGCAFGAVYGMEKFIKGLKNKQK